MRETTGLVGARAVLTVGFAVLLALGPAALCASPAQTTSPERALRPQGAHLDAPLPAARGARSPAPGRPRARSNPPRLPRAPPAGHGRGSRPPPFRRPGARSHARASSREPLFR